MNIYLVGGAVRDALLGYPYTEKDWVVTGASPTELESLGFSSVGKDFPVFLHPKTKEEYALARTERKTRPGYTGFEFNTSPSVTLEQDLSRRDLTINAIAKDERGQIIDPFNGKRDIEKKLLRHVSPAFSEDPVRLLRVARFAARYYHLGFSVAPETMTLLKSMVANGEIDALVAERCWKEFHKALNERHPEIFILVLRDCGALARIMPELDAVFGVPQVEKYHPEIDTGLHSLMSLKQACELSDDSSVRFASLMHDLGKALTEPEKWPSHHNHEKCGLPALAQLCERLKVPKEHYELARLAMEFHTHTHRAFELKPTTILKLLKRTDAYRKPERFLQFLLCCKADAQGRTGWEQTCYPQANYLAGAREIANAVKTNTFVQQGLKGKAIGDALESERMYRLENYVKPVKAALNKIPL